MGSGPSLRIVAINDVYSLENLPRLRTLVEHHRTTNPADVFLVTLAGDFVAPSVLSSLDAGRGMVDCMNAVGVTHATFGNHEDDITIDELKKRISELKGVWLATNVHGLVAGQPESQVLSVGHAGGRAVKVGLIGVVMVDESVYRSAPFGGAAVDVANVAAGRETARLIRDEGCVCVVPLTHQTIDDDRALALAQREPPYPVLLAGHEHEPHLEQVAGTWIEKAGSEAIHAAIVDLTWSEDAPAAGAPDLPSVTVKLEDVASYEEDADLRLRVNAHMVPVHALENAPLLTIPRGHTFSSVGTRLRQTSFGTLLCSRVRDSLGADACIFNGGGIRASHEYTTRITFGDVKAEIPFDNEVVVATLPGAVVADAIRASRSHLPAESGGFLQVDDHIMVSEDGRTLLAIAGATLDLAREYKVALVRNLMMGLDHNEPLVAFAKAHPDRVPPMGCGREIKLLLVDAFSADLWDHLGGFDAVDTNHDGKVTEPEIAAAIGRVMASAPSDVAAELVLHALDADQDHELSRKEAEKPRGGDP